MRQMKPADRQDKLAVIVGTVTNDIRILEVPKMTVSSAGHWIVSKYTCARCCKSSYLFV